MLYEPSFCMETRQSIWILRVSFVSILRDMLWIYRTNDKWCPLGRSWRSTNQLIPGHLVRPSRQMLKLLHTWNEIHNKTKSVALSIKLFTRKVGFGSKRMLRTWRWFNTSVNTRNSVYLRWFMFQHNWRLHNVTFNNRTDSNVGVLKNKWREKIYNKNKYNDFFLNLSIQITESKRCLLMNIFSTVFASNFEIHLFEGTKLMIFVSTYFWDAKYFRIWQRMHLENTTINSVSRFTQRN